MRMKYPQEEVDYSFSEDPSQFTTQLGFIIQSIIEIDKEVALDDGDKETRVPFLIDETTVQKKGSELDGSKMDTTNNIQCKAQEIIKKSKAKEDIEK
jgi:hypothetical protein